jgi:enoyl-CoA hydratase/carnithine racemase
VSDILLVENHGRARVLTLNRPQQKNAFNDALYDAVRDGLADARDDDSVAVVVITGAGGAFSAGQDLGEMATRPSYDDHAPHGFNPFVDGLMSFAKPLIAAVDGVAVGVGLTMLLHCDLVLVGPKARLRAPFVSLGIAAEAGSTALLPATIGPQETAALLFRSSWVDADEAVRIGLAWRKADDVLAGALDVAGEIAQMPILSLVPNKKALLAARHDLVQRARETENATLGALAGNAATMEALRAFREKRAPDFSKL